MDDQELDRMDLCHQKYFSLLKQRRFLSPINENPQRILDLGCGTGNSTTSLFTAWPLADIVFSKEYGVSRSPMNIQGHRYDSLLR